jgi:hypothetical protein
VLLPFADATTHLGVFAIVLLMGFAIGIYGHLTRSRALILTGIIVIAVVSLYFVEVGEVASINK